MLKPKHLSQEYGDQFRDLSVASSYRKRPKYDSQVIDILADLVKADSGSVLDVGCGTGEIAIPMSRRGFKVDAVDPSPAMLDIAKSDMSDVTWHCSYAEQIDLTARYDLICCANSIHWMNWEGVFPKFLNLLSENGFLAIVTDGGMEGVAGYEDIVELISRYSTNQDYVPFSVLDVLNAEGYFETAGSVSTEKIPVSQSPVDYIESFHARNGFSVERMGGKKAQDFDRRLAAIVEPHLVNGLVCGYTKVNVTWGNPRVPQR